MTALIRDVNVSHTHTQHKFWMRVCVCWLLPPHWLQWCQIFSKCRWWTVIICQLHHPERLLSSHCPQTLRLWTSFSPPAILHALSVVRCVANLRHKSLWHTMYGVENLCVCLCMRHKCSPFLLADWRECLWGFALFRCASHWQLQFMCARLPACLPSSATLETDGPWHLPFGRFSLWKMSSSSNPTCLSVCVHARVHLCVYLRDGSSLSLHAGGQALQLTEQWSQAVWAAGTDKLECVHMCILYEFILGR